MCDRLLLFQLKLILFKRLLVIIVKKIDLCSGDIIFKQCWLIFAVCLVQWRIAVLSTRIYLGWAIPLNALVADDPHSGWLDKVVVDFRDHLTFLVLPFNGYAFCIVSNIRGYELSAAYVYLLILCWWRKLGCRGWSDVYAVLRLGRCRSFFWNTWVFGIQMLLREWFKILGWDL